MEQSVKRALEFRQKLLQAMREAALKKVALLTGIVALTVNANNNGIANCARKLGSHNREGRSRDGDLMESANLLRKFHNRSALKAWSHPVNACLSLF